MKKYLLPRAIELRKQGFSMNMIQRELGIAKSTVSLWIRSVQITRPGLLKLKGLSAQGRARSTHILRTRRIARDNILKDLVKEEVLKISLDENSIRLFCSCLYWAEGSKDTKRGMGFTNSDPSMITIFLKFLRSGFDIKEEKLGASLHLHEYHNRPLMLKFWSKVCAIPIDRIKVYNKPNSGINIRPGYPGCIKIHYNDVTLQRQLVFYYEEFSRIMGA